MSILFFDRVWLGKVAAVLEGVIDCDSQFGRTLHSSGESEEGLEVVSLGSVVSAAKFARADSEALCSEFGLSG